MIARHHFVSSWRWISVLVLLILVIASADAALTKEEEEAYQAWAKDAWLPAPFAVRTENPPSPEVLEEYKETFGTWQLDESPSAFDRNAFCRDYNHCDVPQDEFPTNSWQTDSDYLEKFLSEADKLVDRARNAILAEYGKSPEETEMFDLTYRRRLEASKTQGTSREWWMDYQKEYEGTLAENIACNHDEGYLYIHHGWTFCRSGTWKPFQTELHNAGSQGVRASLFLPWGGAHFQKLGPGRTWNDSICFGLCGYLWRRD